MKKYKTTIESAIYFYLLRLGLEKKYHKFKVHVIEYDMYFSPRFIIYYDGTDFCRFVVNDKNNIDNDIKFIFSSPWLIKKLFTIVCKIKKI